MSDHKPPAFLAAVRAGEPSGGGVPAEHVTRVVVTFGGRPYRPTCSCGWYGELCATEVRAGQECAEHRMAKKPPAAELPESFGQLKHPELTQALINAERAGFLRGLGVAARICRDDAAQERYKSCCYRALRDAWTEIEARDGHQGEAVREHCGQFAWAAGEGAEDA